MTRPPKGRRAAVLAAALHSWATTTSDSTEHVARLIVRQPPGWQEAGIDNLTDHQVSRLIAILRADLIPTQPPTHIQITATLDQLLAEWRAEGKTTIRPADLCDSLPRLGCTAADLASRLNHLVDQGYLRETRRAGTYRLTPTRRTR